MTVSELKRYLELHERRGRGNYQVNVAGIGVITSGLRYNVVDETLTLNNRDIPMRPNGVPYGLADAPGRPGYGD